MRRNNAIKQPERTSPRKRLFVSPRVVLMHSHKALNASNRTHWLSNAIGPEAEGVCQASLIRLTKPTVGHRYRIGKPAVVSCILSVCQARRPSVQLPGARRTHAESPMAKEARHPKNSLLLEEHSALVVVSTFAITPPRQAKHVSFGLACLPFTGGHHLLGVVHLHYDGVDRDSACLKNSLAWGDTGPFNDRHPP